MKDTDVNTEKTQLQRIREIMQPDPNPCLITPREPQPPGTDEEREFMSSAEIWAERLERLEDE